MIAMLQKKWKNLPAALRTVLTLLAVSNCTHKESYIDICITTCIIPLVSSLGLALIWGLFL